MKLLLSILMVGYCITMHAQKPVIDPDNFGRDVMRVSSEVLLRADGKYVTYASEKASTHTKIVTIQSVVGEWKKEIAGASSPKFADKGKVIFIMGSDSLYSYDIASNITRFLTTSKTYFLPKTNINWMLLKDPEGMSIYNLGSNNKQNLGNVTNYILDDKGKILLIGKEDSINSELKLINTETGQQQSIWSSADGSKASGYTLDPNSGAVAFIVTHKNGEKLQNELWYSAAGASRAKKLVSQQSSGIQKGYILSENKPEFSKEPNRLFFLLKDEADTAKVKSELAGVDVWSYTDERIVSAQLYDQRYNHDYKAMIDLQNDRIIQLESKNIRCTQMTKDFAILRSEFGMYAYFETSWNRAAQYTYKMIGLKDGTSKQLNNPIPKLRSEMQISPNAKWMIYYDLDKLNFFSLETATGILRNITKSTGKRWQNEEDDRPEPYSPGSIFFTKSGDSVIVADTYDLWYLDPAGLKSPVNLTKGYGRKNNIQFEILQFDLYNSILPDADEPFYLRAVNVLTKDWGFYLGDRTGKREPQKLNMGPYTYNGWSGHDSYFPPVKKADNAAVYLVTRCSATDAPNYFFTKDFKTFRQLTDFQPQKSYNWFTSELHSWKSPDGSVLQGVLYKPENFDPSRKYPVILDYYEKRSDELNMYRWPHLSDDRINIPLFVSSGFLVFTPDIKYKIGEPGESACRSIVSAGQYLKNLPFIDGKRMGLQGHSFGGYETNYVVTHSDLFAAACSAAGFCDLVSFYGADARGTYPMYWAERIQGRMGVTLWERPELYIKNSPVFHIDNVKTPMLLMHNKGDRVVPFAQALEFYLGLRRLGKRAWLLQYDDGGHSVGGQNSEKDFHQRMMQFFDHYLRSKPAPVWMTQGIPVEKKGIEGGFEMDTQIATPGSGLTDLPVTNQ
jgi:dipeptidyl aminopeptidase/acylaminoacyl peptidase